MPQATWKEKSFGLKVFDSVPERVTENSKGLGFLPSKEKNVWEGVNQK